MDLTIEQAQSELIKRYGHLDGFLAVVIFDEHRLVALVDKQKPQVREEIPSWIQGFSVACMSFNAEIIEDCFDDLT